MDKFLKKAAAFFRGEGFLGTAITALLIGVVIAVNTIVYTLTTTYGLYLYTLDSEDLTISGATDGFFERVNTHGRRVKVIFCTELSNITNGTAGAEVISFHDTVTQFSERYPDLIELEYVNVITKRNHKGELVDLSQYQEEYEGVKQPIYSTSVIFSTDITFKTLQDIGQATCTYAATGAGEYAPTSYNGEEVCAAMIKWVFESDHKTAYITTYHGETYDMALGNMLSCAGYKIDTINLKEVSMIPEDAALVAISNPIKDFESADEGSFSEIEKLDAYLKNGGSLYVALDPYVSRLPELEKLLSDHGIEISYSESGSKNIVRDSEQGVTHDYFTLIATPAEGELGNTVNETIGKYGSNKVLLKECAALKLSGGAVPVLVSSPSSELYSGGKRTDSAGSYAMAAVSVKANENGTKSKLFVVPSVYLTTTDTVIMTNYANRDFVYSVFDKVFDTGAVPYGCNIVHQASGALENLTMGTARIYAAIIFTVPAVIAIFGAVVIIRRKNR